jgi:UDPglucose--hexose-1-phosphate uridylyltransferase
MSISFHSDTLADGREILYVDDAKSTLSATRKLDQRELGPRPDTPEMRLDPLTGEWVSIVPTRQSRVMLPGEDHNPLAPQTATNPSEIPDNYDVVVFENRSPSFGPATHSAELPDDLGFGVSRPATGRCEVVCFSPDSQGSLGTQSVRRVRTVIEAWAHRTENLGALPGVQQVFVFENRGEAIGVTLHHPHGQIYAYPFITPRTQRLLHSVQRYGASFFADLLAFEQAGPRVIHRGEHFSAFVPFAARWPLEIHLLPHRHVADFVGLSSSERDELAVVYRALLQTLDALYDTPTPYISAWHQAPVHSHRDSVRLMLQLTSPRRAKDKLKYLAGSEAAMGAFIGDIAPERQAQELRSALSSTGLL